MNIQSNTLKIFIILLFTVTWYSSVAQNQPCATGMKIIPIGTAGVADLERVYENINVGGAAYKSSDTLIFPTVIHIIHDSIWTDIPDSQVIDGLRILNEDFNRMNADTSATRDVFKPYAAAVGFKFILAKLDSNGDSTSGIVRVDTNLFPHPEPTDPDFDNVKFVTHWPADMYYNIWLVSAIQGGSLGYAQYPGTDFTYGGPWETWGIVVRSNRWGTVGNSVGDGRTGTHEIGHTFGLYHTFLSSSANCGTVCDTTGDEVCDTPPAEYSGACSQLTNTCSNDTSGSSPYVNDTVDQIENYMSYNSCQNMFSEGQKTRMRGFIASFPILQGLSSDDNLIATGLMAPLSLEDADKKPKIGFTVFPNPGNGRFTLEINAAENMLLQIAVCNMLGQEIIRWNGLKSNGYHQYTLDLSSYPSGLYNITIVAKDEVSSRKVIKE